jgi:hypothetical protein
MRADFEFLWQQQGGAHALMHQSDPDMSPY